MYQKDGKIWCSPLMHMNLVSFMAMPPRRAILCTKRDNAHFLALTDEFNLMKWSMGNGQLLSCVKISQKF